MKFFVSRIVTIVFASLALSGVAKAEVTIPSTLTCSALSTNPKAEKFTAILPFVFADNALKAHRLTISRPGSEVFSGTVSSNKDIKITGRGAYDTGGDPWRYEFSGSIQDGDITTIYGSLDTEKGAHRNCTIAFLLNKDKLLATASVQTAPDKQTAPEKAVSTLQGQQEQTRKLLADMTKDLQDKQKTLQAAQEELKKQQADAVRDLAEKQKALQTAQTATAKSLGEKQKALEDEQEELKKQKDLQAATANSLTEKQKALQAEQDKLSLVTKDINNRQKTLEAGHSALKQEQANTTGNLKWVENVLGGIILPTTEDPKSWMMRVAAVPVQQQQFCRIVDRFYDDLANIYQAHNDIKKNSLFRERKEEMTNLLPKGEFTNWVVQIKEVTQAPDGSAAVMLQPPCRAMLGSDACQKNDSKVRATIAADSPLYHELSKVSAGDFVVISGRILYAESTDSNQPLPTYAVYQAGSHCSAVEESKQEDVFVTEISYLAQLR